MPTYQFGNAFDLKDITCLTCKEVVKCNFDKLTYCPIFRFNRTYMGLHQRINCRSCIKDFTSIDSEILGQVPTRIVERFPFVAPIRGPGVHVVMMIYQFVTLNLKQTSVGIFLDSIKQYSLQHTREILRLRKCLAVEYNGFVRWNNHFRTARINGEGVLQNMGENKNIRCSEMAIGSDTSDTKSVLQNLFFDSYQRFPATNRDS